MNTPFTNHPRQRTLLSLGTALSSDSRCFRFRRHVRRVLMQIFKMLCAINVILALSLNLINGFTGLFSLGHARVHGGWCLHLRHP